MLRFSPCRSAESGVFPSVLGCDRGGGVREKGRAIDCNGEKTIEGGGSGDRLGYFATGGSGDRSLRSIIVVNFAKVMNNFEPQNGHDRYGVWV